MKRLKKYWIVFCIGAILIASIISFLFSTEVRAERLAFNLADIICAFRESYGDWPHTLNDLPEEMVKKIDISLVKYNREKLTLTVPVSVVRNNYFDNLRNNIFHRNIHSKTTTTDITVYISTRYSDRNPKVLKKLFEDRVSGTLKSCIEIGDNDKLANQGQVLTSDSEDK